MGARAEQLLALARAEIGVKESPAGSNNVKYNTAYYGGAVKGENYAWCAAFVWWLFQQARAPELYFDGKKTTYVPSLMVWARSGGLFASDPAPGDLICFDFNGNGVADHIGICESATAKTVTTIDGNTGVGNEANGGAVMRRTRDRKYILGVIRPKYHESEDEDMDIEKLTDRQLLRLAERIDEARAKQDPADWSEDARIWAEETKLIVGDGKGNMKYKVNVTCERLIQLLYNLVHKVL